VLHLLRFVKGYGMQNLCCCRGCHMPLLLLDIFSFGLESWWCVPSHLVPWILTGIEFMFLISYADQKGPSCSSHVEYLLMASDPYHFFNTCFAFILFWIQNKFSWIVNVPLFDFDWYYHLTRLQNYSMIVPTARIAVPEIFTVCRWLLGTYVRDNLLLLSLAHREVS
jgi:hypothetical protein